MAGIMYVSLWLITGRERGGWSTGDVYTVVKGISEEDREGLDFFCLLSDFRFVGLLIRSLLRVTKSEYTRSFSGRGSSTFPFVVVTQRLPHSKAMTRQKRMILLKTLLRRIVQTNHMPRPDRDE
jgi:hypothetical protein